MNLDHWVPSPGGPLRLSGHAASESVDREQLLDRLQHLRGIISAFAQEAASARRHAAQLRVENRRLLEEIRELQSERRDV